MIQEEREGFYCHLVRDNRSQCILAEGFACLRHS
jgi:hypothetical protein